jgi:signal transduction histidine kinase
VAERSHLVSFRPRARLVSVLGEHLISDQAVGLIELVKNAYDADATEVVVELLDVGDPTRTSIVVTDNGSGMTLDDLVSKWLSPAVDHKERGKQQGERTARGRLPIGEKGVGRFAVHHMGRGLLLTTRAVGNDEIVLEIDWDRFDENEAFLDGMGLIAVERAPRTFTGESSGTRLEVTRARAPWTHKLMRKVHRTLKRLQSPLREELADFQVRLVCPDYPELQDIDPSDILDNAHYEFRAVIQPDGECDYEYVCRHPAVAPRSRSGTETLIGFGGDELAARAPECGPFWLNLYVWDRSSDFLQASGVSRSELDAFCGVSLFRDGLRALPYGEPGDDWLFLDQERIQAPAERIGNNQVIGLVLVDQSTNLQLRDKTNREGLIENQAFQDLRTLVRAAIRLYTTHWRRDRPTTASKRPVPAAPGDINTAKALASAIGETARDDVAVRWFPSLGRIESGQGGDGSDGASAEEILTQRQAVGELLIELDGVGATLLDQQRQQDIMRQLAATGLAAERVVHEFGRQVGAAMLHVERLETLARHDAATRELLAAVAVALRTLRNEFRVLAPYESAGRADRMRVTSVADAVELALLLNQNSLRSAAVEASVHGHDFTVRSRPAAVVQILDNLIHNASYWVATGGAPPSIGVFMKPAAQQVVVADSGPGVHPEVADHLFQPFTTLKVEGTGLGLFISAELARSLGCTLRLATDEERPEHFSGAAFVLEFPERGQSDKEKRK